jgi:hypothetical protein
MQKEQHHRPSLSSCAARTPKMCAAPQRPLVTTKWICAVMGFAGNNKALNLED